MTDGVLHYNRVACALHWTIAILIVANLLVGLFHDAMKGWPVMPVHKSIGLTVLALSLFRLIWRITHPAPPLPNHMSRLEAGLAHGLHWLLYGFMIVMPLSGWIMSSAGDRPLNWFWMFDVPKFAVAKGDAITGLSRGAHTVLGYTMAVLVLGHIGAALRHHFILKDRILNRMLKSAPTLN